MQLFPNSEDVNQKLSAKGGASLLLFLSVCCTFDYSASIMSVVDQPLFIRVAVWSRAIAEMTVLLSMVFITLTRSAPIASGLWPGAASPCWEASI